MFSPKKRQALIEKSWKDELINYIGGILKKYNHKPIAIEAMPDHIHIFFGYDLNQTIPDLVEEIKTSTNQWIKERKLCKFHIEWQKGYGAFTHSHNAVDNVAKYVLNQELHHQKINFREEYLNLLKENDIAYDEKYLFEYLDDIKDVNEN